MREWWCPKQIRRWVDAAAPERGIGLAGRLDASGRDARKRSVGRRALTFAVKVCVLILALAVLFRWFEHSQVYCPSTVLDCTGAALGRAWEDVDFNASDGTRLHGWFFPGENSAKRGDQVFLICHGNGGNISHRLETYAILLRTGANVFAFDYRGYGRSSGRPSEHGTYLDGQAALQWLLTRGFKMENLFLYGESLGGGIASELARHARVGGLILASSYTSVPALGEELFPWLPVQWISTIKYDTLGKLPRVQAPVLILHSRADRMIGFHHAEKNFAAANEPKMLWEIDGDHNDPIEFTADKILAGILEFLTLAGPD
jgi:fermentation-respiration switch protein FrsA (DUF1100 family)